MSEKAICQLCGEPMPPGEEMFNFHGYSGPCPKPPLTTPRPERPLYRKVSEQEVPKGNWMIVCDTGLAEHIVCTGMYEWAADWLITLIQGKPYPATAPEPTKA